MCLVPVTVPGGKPDTDVPGPSPRLPLITVAPLLVTVEPARTAKLPALPSATGACPALAASWTAIAMHNKVRSLRVALSFMRRRITGGTGHLIYGIHPRGFPHGITAAVLSWARCLSNPRAIR